MAGIRRHSGSQMGDDGRDSATAPPITLGKVSCETHNQLLQVFASMELR